MIDFILTNWAELLVGLMAFAKVIVNLIPSEKPIQVWTWIDVLINAIITDQRTNGQKD